MQIPRRPGAAPAGPGLPAAPARVRGQQALTRLPAAQQALTRLRAAQHGLDAETRTRRLLVGLALPQGVLILVLLLSGAYLGLVVAVLAVAVQAAVVGLLVGPADPATAPAADPTLAGVLDGQRAEIALLHAEATRSAATLELQAELSRRHQALLLRQLGRIDEMEAREPDPTTLGELFALDHLATRMRRCSESVLVLADTEPRITAGAPVAASEVLRGAVAEIEEFQRVDVSIDADVELTGSSAVDLVHLLAELVENATVFSSPTTRVRVHGQVFGDGYVVTVADEGVGFDPTRADEIAALLSDPQPVTTPGQLGYQVVARLARRHGVAVLIRAAEGGGADVAVSLPAALVVAVARPLAAGHPRTRSNADQAPVTVEPVAAEPGAAEPGASEPVASALPLAAEPEATPDLEPEPEPAPLDVIDAWTIDLEPAPGPGSDGGLLPAAWDLEPAEVSASSPEPEPAPLAWQPPLVPAAGPADVSARAETPSAPFVPPATLVSEEHRDGIPAPAVDGAGLRQRTPQAHMARQMHGIEAGLPGDVAVGPSPDHSRHLLSAYRDGLVLGRGGLAEDDVRTHLEDRAVVDPTEAAP